MVFFVTETVSLRVGLVVYMESQSIMPHGSCS